jgi:hypothetical protein
VTRIESVLRDCKGSITTNLSFTIQQALIPVESGYEVVDANITEERITAIASRIDPARTKALPNNGRSTQSSAVDYQGQ